MMCRMRVPTRPHSHTTVGRCAMARCLVRRRHGQRERICADTAAACRTARWKPRCPSRTTAAAVSRRLQPHRLRTLLRPSPWDRALAMASPSTCHRHPSRAARGVGRTRRLLQPVSLPRARAICASVLMTLAHGPRARSGRSPRARRLPRRSYVCSHEVTSST